MSTPDSGLSPQERAAFADLEAAVRADDPQMAARMRSATGGHSHARTFPPRLVAYLVGRWRIALRHSWWGAPALVVGLALTVLSMSTSILAGVVGLLIAAVGTRLIVEQVRVRWDLRRSRSSN